MRRGDAEKGRGGRKGVGETRSLVGGIHPPPLPLSSPLPFSLSPLLRQRLASSATNISTCILAPWGPPPPTDVLIARSVSAIRWIARASALASARLAAARKAS